MIPADVDGLELFQGCLMGVMIGDAMGQPAETLKRKEILAATDNKGITGFVDPIQTKIKETRNLKSGDTTDDWELTKTVAESLIFSGGFDYLDMVHRHIFAYDKTTVGWGGTLKDGIADINEFYVTNGDNGRNPWAPPIKQPKRGLGNGVAMRIAPLALYYDKLDDNDFLATAGQINQLAKMTHWDDQAMICAYILAKAIHYTMENYIETSSDVGSMIDCLIQDALALEALYPNTDSPVKASDQLIVARKNVPNAETIFNLISPSFTAPTSVIYAIGIFGCYPIDFEKVILTCVNDGGDSDSTASMAGALCGANLGIDGIREDWHNFRPSYQEAIDLATKLYNIHDIS